MQRKVGQQDRQELEAMERNPRVNWIGDDDRLWPMQAFFNEIPDEEFIATIRDMVHGVGSGFDGVVCSFPDNFDPDDLDDQVFQGAEFFVYNFAEVNVDYQTLMVHLRLASDRHVKLFPDDRFILDRILECSELT